jgi:hypothetical protein
MKSFKFLFNNSIFNYLILLMSLAYSLVFIFYGIDFTDSFYYINLCKDYTSSPMIILTLLIGKCWMLLFGDSLISLRVLNWVILILTIFLPFIMLIPSNSRKENLKYLSISIILITILNDNVFGGDVCTLFFLALSISFLIKFLRSNKLIHLLLYGITSSLLILVRFPNILILPASAIIFGIIGYSKNYQKPGKEKILLSFFKTIGTYFSICILLCTLIIMIVYGSVSEFTSRLSFSIGNIDESHSIIPMFRVYCRDFIKLFQYTGVCVLIFLIVNNNLKFNGLIQKIFRFSAVIFLALFLKVEIGIMKYNWNISLFYSAIVCSILISYSVLYVQNKEYNKLILISIVLFFSIIPVLGSNTGLLKFSYFSIAFLPTLLASNRTDFNRNSRLNYLFAVFFLFTFYTKMMVVYEDSKISSLRYELKIEKLRHIKTTKANVQFIEDVLKVFKEVGENNEFVLFYGKVSHVFYYLTNTKSLYQDSFWMSSYDLKEVKKAEQVIVIKRPVVFYMPSYPVISAQYLNERTTNTPFEAMLIKNGYSASLRSNFILYRH